MTPHLVFVLYLRKTDASGVPAIATSGLQESKIQHTIYSAGHGSVFTPEGPEHLYAPARARAARAFASPDTLPSFDHCMDSLCKNTDLVLTHLGWVILEQKLPFGMVRIATKDCALRVHGVFTSAYDALVVTDLLDYKDLVYARDRRSQEPPFVYTFEDRADLQVTINTSRLLSSWGKWSRGLAPSSAGRFLILDHSWSAKL